MGSTLSILIPRLHFKGVERMKLFTSIFHAIVSSACWIECVIWYNQQGFQRPAEIMHNAIAAYSECSRDFLFPVDCLVSSIRNFKKWNFSNASVWPRSVTTNLQRQIKKKLAATSIPKIYDVKYFKYEL